jgi:regulator of protease activity HflC (stomatin/prohibitin superfamily)
MDPLCIGVLLLFGLLVLSMAIHVLNEYERGVLFRLGRYIGVRGPGLVLVLPFVERLARIDLRTFVIDVRPQEVITRDNVPIKVNAVVYARVFDPEKAICEVSQYDYATTQRAQTTLRSVIGHETLDSILVERDKINKTLQGIIDEATDPWGVKVSAVEIKDVELPQGMQRAMAAAAEAERDRRARVIMAQGELDASAKIKEAAKILNLDPAGLRYLQTITNVAAEKNTTILIPMEMLRIFGKK